MENGVFRMLMPSFHKSRQNNTMRSKRYCSEVRLALRTYRPN